MKACVVSPGVVHAVPRTVAIADQFDEVHFIDMKGGADSKALEASGVIFHGAGDRGKSPMTGRQLRALLEIIVPDVIICHFASGDHFFNAIAYGRCPVAVVAMGHDVLFDEGDSTVGFFRRLLTKRGLMQSSYISAKSGSLLDRIRSYGVGTAADVNFWGTDFNRFTPGDKGEARSKLGWDTTGVVILSPRAIEPRLNIHLIIEAFPVILSRYPDALLVLLGRSDPVYKGVIEEQIRRLGVSENVKVLYEVTQDVLPLYYQASDVVVSMARSEGFPNTLLEVMGCKVSIVVGRIPQITELLEDDRNARICELETARISAAILDILDHREKAQRLADEAYVTVRQHADIRKNGIRFCNEVKGRLAVNRHARKIQLPGFRMLYLMYRVYRRLAGKWKGRASDANAASAAH